MNDRFKFRGMTLGGEWVYGNLAIINKKIKPYRITIDEGYYISNKVGMPFAYPVRPETIGQCTGLKDKNGNLIYESDLVRGAENTIGIVKYGKHPRTNSDSMELGFYIEWQMKYPYRSDICYWTSPENKDCIEIIGNIHGQAEQKDNK